MYYQSVSKGPCLIEEMHPAHIENAIEKMERQPGYLSDMDNRILGALKQALDERRRNPSTSILNNKFEELRREISGVKEFQQDLKSIVSKY